MLFVPALRYAAIVTGTILWDAGAVLQKGAVDGLPGPRLPVFRLAGSPRWMAGLLVTGVGWAFYVFGLQGVGISAARTITGGSYVVLALFSIIFLRVHPRTLEWLAVALVTAGILLLGHTEPAGAASSGAAAFSRVLAGLGVIAVLCAALVAVDRKSAVALACLSGLLSSVGDLFVKLLLAAPRPLIFAGCALGLIVFYLCGFYALSRAYRAGTMIAAVVISDFTARAGALILGAVALGEPLVAAGRSGFLRAAGFLLVLGGSLLLGRFSGAAVERPAP